MNGDIARLLDNYEPQPGDASPWFGDPSREPATLTIEQLDELNTRLWNQQLEVCGVTYPHIVYPQAEGWVQCGNCFMPVNVKTLPDGRKVATP